MYIYKQNNSIISLLKLLTVEVSTVSLEVSIKSPDYVEAGAEVKKAPKKKKIRIN